MSQRRRLSDPERWRAVGRLEAGQSMGEVANFFNVSHSTIWKLWKQFQDEQTIKRRPGQGRKRITTSQDDRYLMLNAKRKRDITAKRLSDELFAASNIRISRFTVYRRLAEKSLYARRPMVCVPLTSTHRMHRLNWCNNHLQWNQQDWARVLFTDESRFSLESDSKRLIIWREPGTRYHPSNIRERDRYGGAGLMVWGGIMLGEKTPLHIFESGTLTAKRYQDEILAPFVRFWRGAFGPQFLFMDDNARPHRAHQIDDFLECEDIQRMEWPARSPDLNPIEHLWDVLGRRIAAHNIPPRTLQELKTALTREWNSISVDTINNLINSMHNRCLCCVAVRGDHTPY
jgi:transposase